MKSNKDRATEIFCTHVGMIRKIAYEVSPSRDLTEDIVNDVFVNFVENADKWEYNRDLRPLLSGMTRNIAKETWREFLKDCPQRLGEIYSYLGEETFRIMNSPRQFNFDERLQALDSCKKKLVPKHRLLLDAYYEGHNTLVRIAREQNLKLGTLQKMMCRLREALRICMEKFLRPGADRVR